MLSKKGNAVNDEIRYDWSRAFELMGSYISSYEKTVDENLKRAWYRKMRSHLDTMYKNRDTINKMLEELFTKMQNAIFAEGENCES